MKKLIFVFFAVALLGAGCAQKQVVQPDNGQKAAKSEQIKSDQRVTNKSAAADSVKENQLVSQKLKELQSKIKDIHFDFDKSDIRDDAKATMKVLAGILSKNQGVKVAIEGNCDERGTEEYNIALGDKRADAAKQYLMSLGIPAARISTVSYGKDKPICTDGTEKCWNENRRDHFVLQ